MRLVYSPEFDTKLEGISAWIQSYSGDSSSATKVTKVLLKNCSMLASFPRLGFEIRKDGFSTGLRALIVGNYIVTYTINADQIEVTNLIDSRTEEFQSLID
jgi:plasmid stabilization system protein ParE